MLIVISVLSESKEVFMDNVEIDVSVEVVSSRIGVLRTSLPVITPEVESSSAEEVVVDVRAEVETRSSDIILDDVRL